MPQSLKWTPANGDDLNELGHYRDAADRFFWGKSGGLTAADFDNMFADFETDYFARVDMSVRMITKRLYSKEDRLAGCMARYTTSA